LLRSTLPWGKRIFEHAVGPARRAELALALALTLAFVLCLAIIAGSVFHALTDQALPLMQVGAAYLSAWHIGYMVPGASGGVGVREATLLALIAEPAGEPAALALALVMRVQNVVGDLLFFAASFALPSTQPLPLSPANPEGSHR
jgi:glycosyltransferase 2 family protein